MIIFSSSLLKKSLTYTYMNVLDLCSTKVMLQLLQHIIIFILFPCLAQCFEMP